MKKIILVCFLLAALIISNRASAQQNITTLSYSMGLGLGKTGDFISKYSWRGFAFEYRHLSTPNVGYGVNFGWNTFYQEMPYGTYDYQTISATGYQWRYLNSFPMMAVVDYFASPDNHHANPYFGLGAGVQYNLADADFGVYRFERDAWPFTLAPEVGVLIHTPNGPSFNVGIKYMYGFKTTDLPADSHLVFNVGFAFSE